jgi:hypothetical protein
MLPVMLPDVLGFMQAVALSSSASPPGFAMRTTAASSESWQPSLLLTCLKAVMKCLDDGITQPLRTLEDATRIASHAGAAAAAQAVNRSNTAAAYHNRSQLLLLSGRALYVAACALLRLHEGADVTAQPPGQWKLTADDAEHPPLVRNAPLTIDRFGAYVIAIGRLLPAAGGRSCAPAHVAELQQLQQLLQQRLKEDTLPTVYSLRSGRQQIDGLRGMAALLKELYPAELARQLLQLANGVCTQLAAPGALCCANPACTNCARLSERELVAGKGTVCSSCRAVRLCSAECNQAYWKAGHKQVCERLGGGKQQQTGGAGKQARSGSSSSSGGNCSAEVGGGNRSSSSAGPADSTSNKDTGGSSAAASAEGAAAASALSVRQLKALLAGLRVDFGTAVEKSNLVGALVAHLGLP